MSRYRYVDPDEPDLRSIPSAHAVALGERAAFDAALERHLAEQDRAEAAHLEAEERAEELDRWLARHEESTDPVVHETEREYRRERAILRGQGY